LLKEARNARAPGQPCSVKMCTMKVSALVIPILLLTAGDSNAQTRTATAAERAACEDKIQKKIDAIDSKMRSEYAAPEGERLKEKRRKLETERYECRKAK
jgi:uncharacterized protein